MSKSKPTYRLRMEAVIDYIDAHLDDSLNLERLSEVANFSKYHFHRQFRHYTGIAVFQLIQLKRLTRASYCLFVDPERRITDVALAAGFENSESFSRAFKKTFQQTPSQFRQQPLSKPWLEKINLLQLGEVKIMQAEIVEFPETKIALLVHRGSEEAKMLSIRQFIQWRRQFNCGPDKSNTYNIFYGDASTTGSEDYRLGIAASIDDNIEENNFGVVDSTIPAGRCAMVRQIGSPNDLEKSILYLYRDWLPGSGEELRDFPCFVQRVTLASQVPEHQAITDIFLPLQ